MTDMDNQHTSAKPASSADALDLKSLRSLMDRLPVAPPWAAAFVHPLVAWLSELRLYGFAAEALAIANGH